MISDKPTVHSLFPRLRPRLLAKGRPSSIKHYAVFTILFIGTSCIVILTLFLLLYSYFVDGNHHVLSRLIPTGTALAYLAIVQLLWVHAYQRTAAALLILLYGILGTLMVYVWGVNIPFGTLLLAICIITSGILLGSRYILYVTTVTILVLFGLQSSITFTGREILSHPSIAAPHFGDTIALSILLVTLALVAWLYGRQNEQLLEKAHAAEQALRKERDLLEKRVERRTKQLRKAQLDELQQLYHFAEMGQLSTALLHDLANHLAVLTFDMAEFDEAHSDTIKRAKESIHHLEQVVIQTRGQLRGQATTVRFSAGAAVRQCRSFLGSLAEEQGAALTFTTPRQAIRLTGDPLRLTHVVAILVRNAIEAYPQNATEKPVSITLKERRGHAIITVRDWGAGLSPKQQKALFTRPLKSKKQQGTGIGLFVGRHIIRTHFSGSLRLSSVSPTEFCIRIPIKRA